MTNVTNKMWGGRFDLPPSELMNKINARETIDELKKIEDKRLDKFDVIGSQSHAKMLAKQGIITKDEEQAIQKGLSQILAMMEKGEFVSLIELEDIHMNVESKLKELIGDPAGKLHTARSRNDQCMIDFKLYVKSCNEDLLKLLIDLENVLLESADKYYDVALTGCTHLQVAQPITFGHYLLAYFEMFLRDIKRLKATKEIMSESVLGCAALAGTPFNIDRDFTAKELGFACANRNSLDGVADRDFAIDLTYCMSMIAMHLTRINEEFIIWVSKPYNYIKLPEEFTTGSSIMPQKKNPDACELIRGKSGRVFGDLQTLLVIMKGLPLAYNKDMQEDKDATIDAFCTVSLCVKVMTEIIKGVVPNRENMLAGLNKGFPNATDLADYLVKKLNIPFREAHHITGSIVKIAETKNVGLENLELTEMQKVCKDIKDDVFSTISIENSLNSRTSFGGTASKNVKEMVVRSRELLKYLVEQNEK